MAGPAILSLCSGIGGIDLALRLGVPGSRVVCYVEREAYAAAVLAARMAAGDLDAAPVWSDLRSFDGHPWRGLVDGIAAGYPCQPFSVAGGRRGEQDPRHLWPDIRRILGEVRPRWIFAENVPGHLGLGFAEVLADLASLGFDAAWGVFSAAGSGAQHLRRRLYWLGADAHGEGRGPVGSAHDQNGQLEPGHVAGGLRAALPDAARIGLPIGQGQRGDPREELEAVVRGDRWAAEPAVGRVAHGLSSRVDRTRRHRIYALGNAVVPAVAARAFRVLSDRLTKQEKQDGRQK